MGASGQEKEERERQRRILKYKIEQCFEAYSSIKNLKNILKDIINGNNSKKNKKTKKLPIEVYLIRYNSIQNFINNIYDIFSTNNYDENQYEKFYKDNKSMLDEAFEEYDKEKESDIIYSSYNKCNKILNDTNNNKNENKFIIVDTDFMNNFKVNEYKGNHVFIIDVFNNDDNTINVNIKFPASGNIISAKENQSNNPVFSFCKKEIKNKEENVTNESKSKITSSIDRTKESINSIMNNGIVPNQNKVRLNDNFIEDAIIANKHDQNKNKLLLMIKCISYSLLKIKPFFYFLECCGDLIKENNLISKIFLDMKQQKISKNNKFDCINLYNIINKSQKNKIEDIISLLYHQMHTELKVNNFKANNLINICLKHKIIIKN